MKGIWEKVWPELSKNVDSKESIVDVEEIAKICNERGLDNIYVQDIE